jgi:hypothetical protein
MAEIQISSDDVKQAEALKQAVAAPAAGIDVCATWRRVKPFWSWIIKIVKLIPAIGGTIAAALDLLASGLDSYCKTT